MDLPTLDRFKVEKQKGGLKSPFNVAVDEVMNTIKDQPWSYPRWCKYLKGIPPSEIHSILSTARRSKNVGKSFNWYVKQYKK